MRVLLVHNYYLNPGGEDVVFNNEYKLLKKHGIDVNKYSISNKELDQRSNLSQALNSIWSSSSYNTLMEILKSNNYDIVHVHNTHAVLSPSIFYACRENGVPAVLTLHNYRILCPKATLYRDNNVCELCVKKNFPYYAIYYKCYHNSTLHSIALSMSVAFHNNFGTYRRIVNQCIALTNFSRDLFVKSGIPNKKINIKPNFLESDPGFSRKRKNYFLFIGRITEEKGIKTLLNTWSLNNNYPLKIVGDGDLKEYVKTKIDEESLTNVEYLGQVNSSNKIIKLLKDSYCLILPSLWYEGFPMTIVESFATGTPVISSKIGSLAEIVKHKGNGLLFKPGDVHDLLLKIKWAWENEKDINIYGINARKEYEQKYTSKKNYNQLINIYEKAISDQIKCK